MASVGGRVFGNGNGQVLTASGSCRNSAGVICQDLDNCKLEKVLVVVPIVEVVVVLRCVNMHVCTYCYVCISFCIM